MKNRNFIGLTSLALVVSLSGCSTVANYKTDDTASVSRSSVSPENVAVYSTYKTGKKYQVVGGVIASADAGSNADVPVELLKKEAAKLGADGIINLQLAIDMGYWQNAIKATGTAVKFKRK